MDERIHNVGVDRASGAWVTVVYNERTTSPEIEIFDEICKIWDTYGDTSRRIVVDVPIGLCESKDAVDCPCGRSEDGEEITRECDDLARKAVGNQYRSVFTAPARGPAELAANGETEHAEITKRNEELTGKGLSKQAANISKGIVEVEMLLKNDADPEILVEGHPEVCFRAFNGEPLEHSKKTAPGVDERLSAIESTAEYTAGDWRKLAESLQHEDRAVALDDLLDALVLALTACAREEEYKTLPAKRTMDARGLPMQMVYRSKKQLE